MVSCTYKESGYLVVIEISELDLFDNIDVSDFKVVKRLILKKMEILSVVFGGLQSNFLMSQNSDVVSTEVREQILSVYDKIDEIVGECNFKDKNLFLLELIYNGYSIAEVCRTHHQYKNKSTAKALDRIVKKINKQYKKNERSFTM